MHWTTCCGELVGAVGLFQGMIGSLILLPGEGLPFLQPVYTENQPGQKSLLFCDMGIYAGHKGLTPVLVSCKSGLLSAAGDLCRVDAVSAAARVHRGASQPPVPGDLGAEAGPGWLAVQQLGVSHGQPAGAPDEHLPGHLHPQCIPAAAHALCDQPQRQGQPLLSVHSKALLWVFLSA